MWITSSQQVATGDDHDYEAGHAIKGSPEVDKLVALATSHLNAEMSRFVVRKVFAV
jgi:hypothetical protein